MAWTNHVGLVINGKHEAARTELEINVPALIGIEKINALYGNVKVRIFPQLIFNHIMNCIWCCQINTTLHSILVTRICASWNFKYAECKVGKTIVGITIKTQQSHAKCHKWRTFGFSAKKIWVKKGCRATFVVKYK